MDPNKLTEKSQEAVVAARASATERGHSEIDVEHLAVALLDQQGGTVPNLVRALGASPQQLQAAIESELSRKARVTGGSVQVAASARLLRVLGQAQKEMTSLGDEYVSTEHIFMAM